MLLYPEVRRFVCHGSFCFWTVKVHRVARRPLFCSTLVHLFQQGSSLAQSKSHRSRVFRESRFFAFTNIDQALNRRQSSLIMNQDASHSQTITTRISTVILGIGFSREVRTFF
jgi:hypothetical protein